MTGQAPVAVPKGRNSKVKKTTADLRRRVAQKPFLSVAPQIADSIGANFGDIVAHKHMFLGNYRKCASPAVRCHLPPDFLQPRSWIVSDCRPTVHGPASTAFTNLGVVGSQWRSLRDHGGRHMELDWAVRTAAPPQHWLVSAWKIRGFNATLFLLRGILHRADSLG